MHSSFRVLTTVTHCCSASLTICFGVFRLHRTLQHVLLLVLDIVSHHARLETTSLAASATAQMNSSWQFWSTRRWMACLRNTWRMIASWPLLAAADDFDRPTSKNSHKSEWSLIRCCWTTSVQQSTSPSHGNYVILNLLSLSSAGDWISELQVNSVKKYKDLTILALYTLDTHVPHVRCNIGLHGVLNNA